MALRMMRKKHDSFTKQAKELQVHINQKFSDEVLFEGFCDAIFPKSERKMLNDIDEMFRELNE